MAKINVSLATYNEIAAALHKEGQQINDGKLVTLERGTAIVPPIDFRLCQMRKDAADIAGKVYTQESGIDFIEFANKLYQFILGEPQPEIKIPVATKPTPTNKEGW